MTISPLMPLRVQSMRIEAAAIVSVELVAPDGGQLPPFAAGAHIDLHLTLAAKHLLEQQPIVIRHASWYAKDNPTFSDTIALVRRSIWGAVIYEVSGNQHDMVKIPRARAPD